MVFSKKRLLFCLALVIPLLCHSAEDEALQQQRTEFKLALKALQGEQFSTFFSHQKKLGNYPLKNYLEYHYLLNHLDTADVNYLSQFIKQNSHSFYADRLRNAWLNKLAKNKQWPQYIEQYALPQNSARQCTRLTALIKTGRQQQAFKELPALWLVGESQHKNCDSAFQLFENKGKLTEQLRWQRLALAIEQQHFSLANYLAKSVNHSTAAKSLVSRWQSMHKRPLSQLQLMPMQTTKQLGLPKFIEPQIQDQALIEYGLTRLARKSAEKSFAQWLRLKQQYTFSPDQQHFIQGSIATRAALNRQDNTLHLYGDTPNQHWRARAALWQQDWPETQKAIYSLDLEEQTSNRWQYWLARSYAAQGQQHRADSIYHKLMVDRDYYSFLSADKLGKNYQMNHRPLVFSQQQVTAFSNRLDIQQLHEFYVLSLHTEAHRQAYYLKQTLTKHDLELLATLTHNWGWHNQTIALLGKAQSWNDLNLRFPVVYEEKMTYASNTTKLDSSWLLGVVRQESAFNVNAQSPVGARGLMQLMPKTARAIAKRIKAPLNNLSELINPSRNIQLGSAYLRQVYDSNQQNPVLASAAYNAGPHRVSRWLPEKTMPADIWIENIPFNETRKYTANVITYAAIFDHQRNQKIIPLNQRMPAVHPKKQ
ncbi:MAG: soluble lytic murein transglycosylase [Methylophagaceae bacterium]|jgi:soluble lytic murein transglycosylase